MGEYTESFKETMVRKTVGPGARSATALATEVGVSRSALSRWMREYGRLGGKTQGSVAKTRNGPRRPDRR